MAPPDQPIILYCYSFSPYSRKVRTYLDLCGIPYTQCQQSPIMPRPDLAAVGVKYRRIPVLAIGRDLYCDTALILQKLEQLYPDSKLAVSTGPGRALLHLLQKWNDIQIFPRAIETIPPEGLSQANPAFLKDREELWGRPWTGEYQTKVRPEALQAIREYFEFLEDLAPAEGKWALDTPGPSLVDLNALWQSDWLVESAKLPEGVFSSKRFPKLFAWRKSYNEAIEAAKSKTGDVPETDGAEATKRILAADFAEQDLVVDDDDFIGLKKGAEVAVWAAEDCSGRKNHQTGKLVALTPYEVAVETQTQQGETTVRVHLPRWNYKVVAANAVDGHADHHHPAAKQGGDEGLGAEHYQDRH